MSTTIQQKIEETEERLALYIKAEQHILNGGQSYSIGNRSLTKADLENITKMITRLHGDLANLRRGNQLTMQRVVPRDI